MRESMARLKQDNERKPQELILISPRPHISHHVIFSMVADREGKHTKGLPARAAPECRSGSTKVKARVPRRNTNETYILIYILTLSFILTLHILTLSFVAQTQNAQQLNAALAFVRTLGMGKNHEPNTESRPLAFQGTCVTNATHARQHGPTKAKQ